MINDYYYDQIAFDPFWIVDDNPEPEPYEILLLLLLILIDVRNLVDIVFVCRIRFFCLTNLNICSINKNIPWE